ncbi:protein YahL [Escherichia coli]
MISLKAPHNNLMPYTQQSILNTVKNNQLPEDIKSSLVSCVDIFKVLIKQYYDYPYDCRDDLVDDDKLIHLMAAVRDCEWSDDNALTINVQFNDFPGFYDWMDYPDHPVKFVFHILENQKGTVWVYDQDDAFLDIKANVQAGRFTGLKKLVQFIDSVRTDCKCILLEYHMPLLRIFPKGKECMHAEKWLREMSSIPETDAPIKQALAHGLLLHLKNIYPVFPESLVMLLLSVLDVKTYRDDARLNEWISNRVQELGDRYYPVNKHVKIRYTL